MLLWRHAGRNGALLPVLRAVAPGHLRAHDVTVTYDPAGAARALRRCGLGEVLETEVVAVLDGAAVPVTHLQSCALLGPSERLAATGVLVEELLLAPWCSRCDPLPHVVDGVEFGRLIPLDLPLPRASGLDGTTLLSAHLQRLLTHRAELLALVDGSDGALVEPLGVARERVDAAIDEARRRLLAFRAKLPEIAACALLGEQEAWPTGLNGPGSEEECDVLDAWLRAARNGAHWAGRHAAGERAGGAPRLLADLEAAARAARSMPGHVVLTALRSCAADLETLLVSLYGEEDGAPTGALELVVAPRVVGHWYDVCCAGTAQVVELCEHPVAAELARSLYRAVEGRGVYANLSRLADATSALCAAS